MASPVITYLNLGLGNILGLTRYVSYRLPFAVGALLDSAYQVADHNLALAGHATGPSGSGLVCAARGLGALLNATGRRSGSRSGGASCAAGRAAAALLVAPLAGEDLIERLVELAGHDCDGERWM